LDAFAIIRNQHPNAALYLVGGHFGDDYYKSVVKRIESDLQLSGHVHVLGSRNDVSLILSCCDIGVLSSISEGLPVSLLEYGLAKLPVVCTNVGDCSYVLGAGRFGKLVEPNQPENLAQSILAFLNNPSQMKETGEELHHHIIQEFSRDSALEKILAVYNGLNNYK
jgi:glycosyltransferase involved in cell wall biosynthesis